jgi:hypothetical protein
VVFHPEITSLASMEVIVARSRSFRRRTRDFCHSYVKTDFSGMCTIICKVIIRSLPIFRSRHSQDKLRSHKERRCYVRNADAGTGHRSRALRSGWSGSFGSSVCLEALEVDAV